MSLNDLIFVLLRKNKNILLYFWIEKEGQAAIILL